MNLNHYDCVVLDFSAMFVNLDPDLTAQIIASDKIFFAQTFECDCRYFLKSVPDRIRDVYWQNSSVIRFSSDKVIKTGKVTDTYGLASWLSSVQTKTLVIEASLSLEEKIIFSGIGVDVYSWDKERIIRSIEFASERKSRCLDTSKDPLPYYEVRSGSTVYSESGSYILTGDSDGVGSGTESVVYKLHGVSGLLAKIFKKDEDDLNVLTRQKLQNVINLRDLGEDWGVDWLALPQELLYADPALTKPVGYLMKQMNGKFLSENPLFGDADFTNKFVSDDQICVRDVLNTCLQFVSQYMFLSANGVYISDYNDKNFALVNQNGKRLFRMIDTDSFCYDEYVSAFGTYNGCLSRKYERSNRCDLINVCDESLFIFIFTKLMLDPECKPLFKGEFRFSQKKLDVYAEKNNTIKLAAYNSLPKNLLRLYSDIFEKNGTVSVSVLLYELDVSVRQAFARTQYVQIYQGVLDMAKIVAAREAREREKREKAIEAANKASQAAYTGTSTGTSTHTGTSTRTGSSTNTTNSTYTGNSTNVTKSTHTGGSTNTNRVGNTSKPPQTKKTSTHKKSSCLSTVFLFILGIIVAVVLWKVFALISDVLVAILQYIVDAILAGDTSTLEAPIYDTTLFFTIFSHML